MADHTETRYQVIRTLLAFVLVFVLLHGAKSGDYLSAATRPAVVALFQCFGVHAEDQGAQLVVGRLVVPWTRDCAGLNTLAILLALALWLNRSASSLRGYLLRTALAVPIAFVANIGRILTLIIFRRIFFPEIESPALHYFFGFLWLIPAIPLVIPRAGRNLTVYGCETLYWTTALSLLAPFVPAPGGHVVALCALLLLADSRYTPLPRVSFLVLMAGWIAAGLFIGATAMESLWTPWLIVCPVFVSRRVVLSAAGLLLLAGTVPLAVMLPGASWVALAAAAWCAWFTLRKPGTTDSSAPAPSLAQPVIAGLILLMPFIAPILSALPGEQIPPPGGLMTERLGAHAYRIRLIGQSPDIDAVWYSPYGHERHHTLNVCMQFRGITLSPVPGYHDIAQSDRLWMREYFFQDGRLISSYRTYLVSTFVPFSSPGVHVILTAPRQSISAADFVRETGRMATQISALVAIAQARP